MSKKGFDLSSQATVVHPVNFFICKGLVGWEGEGGPKKVERDKPEPVLASMSIFEEESSEPLRSNDVPFLRRAVSDEHRSEL